MASGVIQLGAREWKGEGHFEDLFILLGFGLIVFAVAVGLAESDLGLPQAFSSDFDPVERIW